MKVQAPFLTASIPGEKASAPTGENSVRVPQTLNLGVREKILTTLQATEESWAICF
jgi:hypothetical protein